jgi:uncharacterized Tic20 family protein
MDPASAGSFYATFSGFGRKRICQNFHKENPMPAKNKIPAPVEPVDVIVPATPVETPTPVSPVAPIATLPAEQLGPGDERTWGMLAHLSVLLNLITGFAGSIAALIIYLVYKDRSRLVAYHALQSAIFQLIWWFGGGVLIGLMWAVVGALSAILIGVVLIPFAILFTFVLALLPLGALVYGVIGAVQVSQGQDFKYWLVGDWVRGTLTGL